MAPDDGKARAREALGPLLILTVVMLLIVNLGLFLRMNQLQLRVIGALEGLQPVAAEAASLQGLADGSPVPALELSDNDGHTVTLDRYRGRPVLLAFSSVTCPACEDLYPELRRFHGENPQLALLMVSRGRPEENRALAVEQGFEFPVLHWRDRVARAFQVPATPFFYLVGADGTVVRSGIASTAAQIEELACLDGCGEAHTPG